MDAVGLIASITLGFVFLVSGGSKVAAGPAWPLEAAEMGAPASVVPLLPWAEIVLEAILVMQLAPLAAGIVALLLLVAFTVLIARRLAQGKRPSCACFGAWSSKPIGRGHVFRNVAFIALALVVVWSG